MSKKKVGVIIFTRDLDYLINNVKRNDENEKDLCWYAFPTVNELRDSKPRKVLEKDVYKFSNELDEQTLSNFKPFWSTCVWDSHKTCLDFLIEKGKGEYYVPCMGYSDENRTVFDVQIGLTGTVEESENVCDCARRETFEECNLNVSKNDLFMSIENGNKILYLFEK